MHPQLAETTPIVKEGKNKSCWERVCIAFLLFLAASGAALLIAGLVFLTAPRLGDSTVEQYNKIVAAYNPQVVLSSWSSGTIGGVNVVINTAPVPLVGDTAGITPATSTFVNAILPWHNNTDSEPLAFNLGSATPQHVHFSTASKLDMERDYNFSVTCTSDMCGSCGMYCCSCSYHTMDSACQELARPYGPFYRTAVVYSGFSGTCYEGYSCGTCAFTTGLDVFTAVALEDGSPDPEHQSVFAPFTQASQLYQFIVITYPWTFTARLYLSTDPLIAAQTLTNGAMNFGPSKRTLGIALVASGSALLALLCGGSYFLYRCYVNRQGVFSARPPPPIPVRCPTCGH